LQFSLCSGMNHIIPELSDCSAEILANHADSMAGINPISAKLCCKHSPVIFMSDTVVLKNERRTSNVEYRIMISLRSAI
jgi:hypothetical protein